MNSGYTLTVIVFAAALSACGSKDLDKDQAKGLINAFFDKNPVTHPLATGFTSMGQAPDKEYFDTPGGKYQKALEADGLITITSKGKIYNPADHKQFVNALDIALTDKGRTSVTGKPNTDPHPAPQWPTVYENAVFCGKEVVAVSDVQTTDDSATADYTWRAAKLTPFAVDFQKTDPTDKVTCNPAVVSNANASLVRKGEVWSVTVAQ
jgi:hypothetical protein